MVKPTWWAESSDYLREKYFPSLLVKQKCDLPLRVVMNMGEKVKWSFGGKMRAVNEKVYQSFMEEGVVIGMGP